MAWDAKIVSYLNEHHRLRLSEFYTSNAGRDEIVTTLSGRFRKNGYLRFAFHQKPASSKQEFRSERSDMVVKLSVLLAIERAPPKPVDSDSRAGPCKPPDT